jgi:hypothetical protein
MRGLSLSPHHAEAALQRGRPAAIGGRIVEQHRVIDARTGGHTKCPGAFCSDDHADGRRFYHRPVMREECRARQTLPPRPQQPEHARADGQHQCRPHDHFEVLSGELNSPPNVAGKLEEPDAQIHHLAAFARSARRPGRGRTFSRSARQRASSSWPFAVIRRRANLTSPQAKGLSLGFSPCQPLL